MRALFSILGIGLALALPAAAGAESATAPFGLEWGMEVGALAERNIPIQSSTRSGNLTVVNITRAPETPDDTYLLNLLFDRDHGLVKVRWMSRDIVDDAAGEKGRRKYDAVRRYVVQRYGEPTNEALVVGARLFDQPDEFYQCLAYEGCGVWSAIWEQGNSGGILLSVEGLGAATGFVQLDFESAGWQASASASR